jgi:hypothetical protein
LPALTHWQARGFFLGVKKGPKPLFIFCQAVFEKQAQGSHKSSLDPVTVSPLGECCCYFGIIHRHANTQGSAPSSAPPLAVFYERKFDCVFLRHFCPLNFV